MRSVPHRVVCLLGLDDGVFPRAGRGRRRRRAGPRPDAPASATPRSEDRQLLLDAILAATETLVITYTGANEAHRAAAAARRTARRAARRPRRHRHADGGRCPTRVAVRHPLQPFDAGTSHPAAAARRDRSPSTRGALAGARAAAGPRTAAGAVPGRRAPAARAAGRRRRWPTWCAFLEHPVKGFLRATARRRPGRTTRSRSTDAPAGRDRQPGAVGGRRPGARATCSRASTPTARSSSASGGAACCRPGSSAGDARPGSSTRPAPVAEAAASATRATPRGASTSTSTSAAGAGCAGTVAGGVRRPAGAGHLLPARPQAPARVLGAAARAVRRRPGPQLDRPHDRPCRRRPRDGPHRVRCSARSTTPRATCCATWSPCATAAARAAAAAAEGVVRLRPGAAVPVPTRPTRWQGRLRLERRPVPRRAVRRRPRRGLGPARRPAGGRSSAPARGRGVRRRDHPVRRAGAARCGARCSSGRAGELVHGPLRPRRPAADRHHPARGQRRHRQDLHRRRPGRPLRRRGGARRSTSCW